MTGGSTEHTPGTPAPSHHEAANSVLGKARLILECFELGDADLSLTEIARRTGLAKASVHRLNQELLEWGMLERSGQEYRLGLRAFELGSRAPRIRVLRDGIRPLMESLFHSQGETVHLGVLDGLEVVYIEKVASGPHATRPSTIAGRMPLHCTATGKALLAYGPRELLDDVVESGLPRRTPATVVSPRLLGEQVARARERGYATEHEETVVGYCSVAVPVFGHSGLLLAALSITAPTYRADIDRYATTLLDGVRRLQTMHIVN
ncbi:IclR family transcriptional regulator [Nocardioides sp. YIM 152315]|uniref:IclR family transcriptional regulator n=1 Tax=Nocardioides sp. YIM 152315 TaxID=3031760 RepID=UPI0023DC2815|nr:IclR family transcriptional regulator [Nocardioides sp. YIM 152315]MDF1604506.1 IclR family transcriptional regulator [Nocardioides sp. YIM 152315]